jgi:hypothetical protein
MGDTNISLLDLKALSEPASKLIEAVSSAVGVLYEPTRVRRKAKADADAAIILAQGEERLGTALRAAERVSSREIRRQRNIESVVEGALRYLPESVGEEEVEGDWVVQFFDYCQDVGDEEMQSLWAKILAGEVAAPKSYSPRTLHTVKLLRKDDAQAFARFCGYVWEVGDLVGYVWAGRTDALLEAEGLSLQRLIHLQTIGLVQTYGSLQVHEDTPLVGSYHGKRYVFTLDNTVKSIMHSTEKGENYAYRNIGIHLLTEVGRELAPLCGAGSHEEYLTTLSESLEFNQVKMSAADG